MSPHDPPRPVARDAGPARIETSLVAAQTFSGPLPSPAHLKQYDDVCPGAAERIIALAERQAHHRMSLEDAVVRGDGFRATLGVVCATVVSVTLLFVAAYMASLGQALVGAGIAVLDLAALAGVFVYGSRTRKEERENRLQQTRNTRE